MTTPEQQARDMLAALELPFMAEAFSASRLAPLANLIAEHDALKAELAAIKGAGEPVAWMLHPEKNGLMSHKVLTREVVASFPEILSEYTIPLYTRPCVPLTDERIDSMLVTTDGFTERERKIIKIVARATEAAHDIKGAKP